MGALIPLLAAALAGGERRLVVPGALSAPLVLTRAQVTTTATFLGSNGTTWSEAGADVARFQGSAQRLLVEGQRSNFIRNPRFEGGSAGVIGSGGVYPTNHSLWGAGTAGLTFTRLANQTINGITGLVVQIAGTASAASLQAGQFDNGTQFVPASGVPLTGTLFFTLLAGSFTGVNAFIVTILSATGPNTVDMRGANSGVPQRFGCTGTGANVATRLRVGFTPANVGAAIDMTVFFAWPTLDEGAIANTPILPSSGTGAVQTRMPDLVSAPLASLGAAGGAFTVLWSGMLPQQAPTGADQVLLQADDGTGNNLVRLRNPAGGASVVAGRIAAGTPADATTLGTMTPGTAFRCGLTRDAAGRLAACIAGGSVQAVTGAPGGLTTLRLGTDAAGASAMFGETGYLTVLPRAVQDAELLARVNALAT